MKNGPADQGCGGNPFQCASRECVSLLLRLTFNRAEVEELLSALDAEVESTDLKLGAAYRRLTELALYRSDAALKLDQLLAARLESEAETVAACPLYQLAVHWVRVREELDGRRAAALLWTVARSASACYRKLEAVMVDDLNYMGAQSLFQSSLQAERAYCAGSGGSSL